MTNSKGRKPNILFLLIDSLRADKSYGENRTCVTPNLDNMIKNGTYFSQAISPSDATVLSVTSIFTGLLPYKTGTVKNQQLKSNMNENIPTIISILKKVGYHIYGKVPSILSMNSIYSKFEKNGLAIISDPEITGRAGATERGRGEVNLSPGTKVRVSKYTPLYTP